MAEQQSFVPSDRFFERPFVSLGVGMLRISQYIPVLTGNKAWNDQHHSAPFAEPPRSMSPRLRAIKKIPVGKDVLRDHLVGRSRWAIYFNYAVAVDVRWRPRSAVLRHVGMGCANPPSDVGDLLAYQGLIGWFAAPDRNVSLADLERLIDDRFVRALDETGAIGKMYGRYGANTDFGLR